MKLKLFDSSLNALQLCFCVRDDWTKCLAANSRKLTAGVGVRQLFLSFLTKRLLESNRHQKTFDRTFKELSNDVLGV